MVYSKQETLIFLIYVVSLIKNSVFKKSKLTISLLVAALAIGFLTSCKKDREKINPTPAIVSDAEIANKIREFKNIGVSNFKSRGEITIEEALWYIATTANYTYSDLTAENEKTWVDTCLITISLSGGKVSLTEVYAKYELMVDHLRTFYAARSEENKQFLTLSLEPVTMDDNYLVCKARAVYTYSLVPGVSSCVFDDTTSFSFWYFWNFNATCDTPSILETDAAEEIQKRIMRCKEVLPSNYYYEPTTSVTIFDPLDYPVFIGSSTPHNYGYSHLYWNSSKYPDFDGCISPYYLNYYLTKVKELIYNDVNNSGIRPIGTALINIDLWGKEGMDDLNNLLYLHQAKVNYGILRTRPDPKDSLD